MGGLAADRKFMKCIALSVLIMLSGCATHRTAGDEKAFTQGSAVRVIDVVADNGALQERPAICTGSSASWSRDGESILFSGHRDGNRDILLIAPDGTNERNLAKTSARDDHPVWSPDGSHIAHYSATVAGTHELRIMNADGSRVKAVATIEGRTWPAAWAPDGQRIAYATGSGEARSLFVVDVATGQLRRLARGGVGYPVWRPQPE